MGVTERKWGKGRGREGWGTYEKGDWLPDMAQEKSDIDKHENVAEEHCEDICLALPRQLIFNGPLCHKKESRNKNTVEGRLGLKWKR